MRLNILIGGKAGQGINTISEILSRILTKHGYYVFNYRDYPSLIRGGHNFNVLSISDKKISSHETMQDILVSLDEQTEKIHKQFLKKDSLILKAEKFKENNLGKNLNITLSASLIKILGIPQKELIKELKQKFSLTDKKNEILDAAELGFKEQEQKFELKKLKNKIQILSGSQAIALGAVNSNIDTYFAYPMTPATGVLHELASIAKNKENNKNSNNKIKIIQPESEIASINSALGASFAGSITMTGTSGGGFDLMSEALSFSGMSELPLVVYLASRPGPGTGVPTYTSQADLDIALRAGHGEFPRIVITPGDAKESIEKTNEAFYLSQKFNTLSIILSDKHLAESQYSFSGKTNKTLNVKTNRNIPGKTEKIIKATSYEHDKFGNTIEDPETTEKNALQRLKKYSEIKKHCNKFEMIKLHGNKNAKNLIISFGSTKGAILDAIESIEGENQHKSFFGINKPLEKTDIRKGGFSRSEVSGHFNSKKNNIAFLQILYLKPLSDKIKKYMKNKNLILIEQNSTGQLGRLLREKTGISIPEKNRILKFNSRPFHSDELKKEIKKRMR